MLVYQRVNFLVYFFSSRLLSRDTLQQIDVDMNIQFIVLIFLMEMESMGFEY